MKIRARHLVGLSVLGGAFAAYRGAKQSTKQNRPFRQAWEKHLLTTIAELEAVAEAGGDLPLIYVALGDSAAQGLGATRREDGYVPRIAAGLEAVTGRKVALLNLSLSGATAASVLGTQLPQLEGLRLAGKPLVPDVVTLDIGGNDVGVSQLSEEEFGEQVRAIIDRLPRPAYVADIPTFRPLKSEKRASAMSALIEKAARAAGVGVIHLEALSNTLTTFEYMVHYHAGDMFHPNSPWYHRWSQLFIDAMSSDLGVPSVDMEEVAPWEPWSALDR